MNASCGLEAASWKLRPGSWKLLRIEDANDACAAARQVGEVARKKWNQVQYVPKRGRPSRMRICLSDKGGSSQADTRAANHNHDSLFRTLNSVTNHENREMYSNRD